jgi:hypothetical protein
MAAPWRNLYLSRYFFSCWFCCAKRAHDEVVTWRPIPQSQALNGINLPLAFIGQEWLWSKVFDDYNVSFAEQQAFFAGAFPIVVLHRNRSALVFGCSTFAAR